jgi:hypothetical protein
MMAFDRTPSPDARALDPATLQALRATLARSVAQGNHADELRDLLCRAAAEARDKDIRAEQLLIVLKDIWYSLPEVVSAPSTEVGHALLQDLVSRCIHEYYAI